MKIESCEEIIKWFLEKHGCDGLCADEGCGCTLDDFAPCGAEGISNCVPAIKRYCTELTEDEKESCEGKPCETCTAKYLMFPLAVEVDVLELERKATPTNTREGREEG